MRNATQVKRIQTYSNSATATLFASFRFDAAAVLSLALQVLGVTRLVAKRLVVFRNKST